MLSTEKWVYLRDFKNSTKNSLFSCFDFNKIDLKVNPRGSPPPFFPPYAFKYSEDPHFFVDGVIWVCVISEGLLTNPKWEYPSLSHNFIKTNYIAFHKYHPIVNLVQWFEHMCG